MTADQGQHERVVIALASRDSILSCDRVLADRLQQQITLQLAQVAPVQAGLARAGLAGVEAKTNVVVPILLGALFFDGAAHLDASGQQLEAVGAVYVGVGIGNADRAARRRAGMRRNGP